MTPVSKADMRKKVGMTRTLAMTPWSYPKDSPPMDASNAEKSVYLLENKPSPYVYVYEPSSRRVTDEDWSLDCGASSFGNET